MAVQADSYPIPDPGIFNHPDDLEFWCKVYPPCPGYNPDYRDTKTFTNIQAQIELDFPEATKLRQVIKVLKRCFGVSVGGEDTTDVTARSFVRMTKWFGPLTSLTNNSCIFLNQIHKLMSYLFTKGNEKISPFAGMITRQNAEEYLRHPDAKPESYLVRFSEELADQGGFALAVKDDDSVIRHYEIIGNPAQALQSRTYSSHLKLLHSDNPQLNAAEREFNDIVEFMKNRLNDEIEEDVYCTHICPNLPCNALFRGYD